MEQQVMINEISYLLFQVVLSVTFAACAAYLVFFITQKKKIWKTCQDNSFCLLGPADALYNIQILYGWLYASHHAS